MITLITGTPGSGKTLFAVTKILEYVEKNKQLLKDGKEPRIIYADIDGLNIEGVEPAPNDWRNTPDGSVIFYDEIQQRAEFKKGRFDNEICDALQVHRHTGHDIFGITQFPVLLHPNFRAVVGMHYHLHRGWGLASATVFSWAYCVDTPNAPTNKRLAEHTFRFNYPKDAYKYYKSATVHTHKARVPKRIFLMVFFILMMGYFAYKLLFQKDNFFKSIYTKKDNTIQLDTPNSAPDDAQAPTTQDTATTANNAITDTNTPQDVNNRLYIQSIEKKYLDPYIIEVAEIDSLRPAGLIMINGQCTALNMYGERLNLTQAHCKTMLVDDPTTRPRTRAQRARDWARTLPYNDTSYHTQNQPQASNFNVSRETQHPQNPYTPN